MNPFSGRQPLGEEVGHDVVEVVVALVKLDRVTVRALGQPSVGCAATMARVRMGGMCGGEHRLRMTMGRGKFIPYTHE